MLRRTFILGGLSALPVVAVFPMHHKPGHRPPTTTTTVPTTTTTTIPGVTTTTTTLPGTTTTTLVASGGLGRGPLGMMPLGRA